MTPIEFAVKFFQDSGVAIYFSIAIMAIGLAIAGERWIFLNRARQQNSKLWSQVLPMLHSGRFKEVASVAEKSDAAIGKIVANGLQRMQSPAISGLDARFIPALRPAKGQYFTYSGKASFSRFIYPLHTEDSQGVHYTRDLGGQARLGPDIRWDAPLGDYSVDETRLAAFVRDVSRFWPALDPTRLNPGYAGQRPKATGPGEEGDFVIVGPKVHGTAGYIGLYAMESPGLTSCLAIGDHVAALARAEAA